MTMTKMTEKEMEDLSACRGCRHLHRYEARYAVRDGEEVEVENLTHILRHCLVSNLAPFLEEEMVVDCNQFERREAKKKL